MQRLHLCLVSAFAFNLCLAPAISNADTPPPPGHQVAQMQQYIKDKGLSFTVGDNWVTRFLQAGGDIKDITGLVEPKNWQENATFVDVKVPADLPAAFDWRTQVPGGLQPIRHQGQCGSCWAFAVTATLESILKIKNPASTPDLAEQTLVSSCSRAGSCSGGYFEAFNYLMNPGLPDETQDPYRAANSICKSGLQPVARVTRWAYIKNGSSYTPTTNQIKAAILQYGPVSVSVNGSFTSYKSGIYNLCNNAMENHMVNLEGWNDEGGYWIMRNSWGTEWGEEGYMRIKYADARGYKCNNIGRRATFAIVDDKA